MAALPPVGCALMLGQIMSRGKDMKCCICRVSLAARALGEKKQKKNKDTEKEHRTP